MTPRIITVQPKKLIGQRINMSAADDKTFMLWSTFMPRRKEIKHAVNTDLISMRVYDSPEYFSRFNPAAMFDKWAVVEVSNFDHVPEGMETFELSGGLYAVFTYKGTPAAAGPFFQSIYALWIPAAGYHLDNRPHFEVMGSKYKHNHPESEEDVYVPVKQLHE